MFSGSLRFLKGKPTAFSASLVVSVVAKCQWKHVSAAVRLATPQKWWVSMWEKMAKYIRLGVVLSCPYWLHVILSAWHCLACPYFDLAPHWRLPHDEISCLTPMKGRLVFLHLTTLELKGGLESAWNQLGISLCEEMTESHRFSEWPKLLEQPRVIGLVFLPRGLLEIPTDYLCQEEEPWPAGTWSVSETSHLEKHSFWAWNGDICGESIHVNIMSISCQFSKSEDLKVLANSLFHLFFLKNMILTWVPWLPWPPAVWRESTNADHGQRMNIFSTEVAIVLWSFLYTWAETMGQMRLNCFMFRCLLMLFGTDLLELFHVVCALCSALMELFS